MISHILLLSFYNFKIDNSETAPTGRRIFDVAYLFQQIFSSEKHDPFDCNITDMYVAKEVSKGLCSTFYLKSKMCGIEKRLNNEDVNNPLSINSAITLGAISTGVGYSQLDEIASSINMPMMAHSTFTQYQDRMSDIVYDTAWKLLEEGGKEEAELARQHNEIDEEGIPYITVVTDGAWCKRSYNVNYDASSGVVSSNYRFFYI